MLPCMPAFALRRLQEVIAGREVVRDSYGKFTMHFAHHSVANVEVLWYYEEEPGAVEFGRPRENIGLKHPDDSSIWCVVRAGYEIAVAYDERKNSVTFVNLKGVFSLRNVSARLAQWARQAEHVLPYTGQSIMRHLSAVLYLPAARKTRDKKEPPAELENGDSEFELFVSPPEGERAADLRLDASRNADCAASGSNAAAGSSNQKLTAEQKPIAAFFERAPVPSKKAADKVFYTFALETAKATYEGGNQKDMYPSADGTGEEENLELQLHDAKLVVVKVRRPPLSVCRVAALRLGCNCVTFRLRGNKLRSIRMS